MASVNLNASALPDTYAPALLPKTVGSGASSAPGSTARTPGISADTVQLSPAALRQIALTGRVSPNAQAIQQLQNQLSQTVYSDAHNGAAPPTDPDVTKAGAREAVQAARIALNETAGNLSSDQASQLSSQLSTIQQQIYDATRNAASPDLQ